MTKITGLVGILFWVGVGISGRGRSRFVEELVENWQIEQEVHGFFRRRFNHFSAGSTAHLDEAPPPKNSLVVLVKG